MKDGEPMAWAFGLVALLGLLVPVGLFSDLPLICSSANDTVPASEATGRGPAPTILWLELAGLRGRDRAAAVLAHHRERGELNCARKAIGADNVLIVLYSAALGLSALLEDLYQRGRLASTLVLVLGEFGRTPRLNTIGGRDHWPRVFSALLAGGGVKGGQVVGQSDVRGESPAERPVTPEDLARVGA